MKLDVARRLEMIGVSLVKVVVTICLYFIAGLLVAVAWSAAVHVVTGYETTDVRAVVAGLVAICLLVVVNLHKARSRK